MVAAKKYKVIQNAPALGVTAEEATTEVTAERFSFDDNANRATFYTGDDVVGVFMHVFTVTPA